MNEAANPHMVTDPNISSMTYPFSAPQTAAEVVDGVAVDRYRA